MKIIGVGIDLVKISRVEGMIRRWGLGFLGKVFTENEQRDCLSQKGKAQYFAGRFAVKEAFLKALGTGMRKGMRWKAIETQRDAFGKPVLKLSGQVRSFADEQGVREVLTSISHDHDYAIAQVMLQGEEGQR